MRLALVTNLCAHYRKPLFHELAQRMETDFFFTSDGGDAFWSRDHTLDSGDLAAVATRRRGALAAALARGRYDCVVAGLVGRLSLVETVAAAAVTRTPLVLWVGLWRHPETLVHRLSRPFVRALYRRADALVVYGPHVAEHVRAETGRVDGVFEACQAVDNEAFRRAASVDGVARVRAELGLGSDPVASFVGRLEPEKGLETLLEALARAQRRLQLMLVGSGSLEPRLRERAASLGVADRVHFAGYVAQEALAPYLLASDMLVLPSITTRTFREPWGLVANEAMNCGVPVVATDAVGAAAGGLVVDGVTGRVVPERDAAALGAALDELAGDPELRARLGARAREHVLGWNYGRAADGFELAIRHAIRGRGALACAS